MVWWLISSGIVVGAAGGILCAWWRVTVMRALAGLLALMTVSAVSGVANRGSDHIDWVPIAASFGFIAFYAALLLTIAVRALRRHAATDPAAPPR